MKPTFRMLPLTQPWWILTEQKKNTSKSKNPAHFLNKEISLCHLTQLVGRPGLGKILCLKPKQKERKFGFISYLHPAVSGILKSWGRPWPTAIMEPAGSQLPERMGDSQSPNTAGKLVAIQEVRRSLRQRKPRWQGFSPQWVRSSRVGAFLISKEAAFAPGKLCAFWAWVCTGTSPTLPEIS